MTLTTSILKLLLISTLISCTSKNNKVVSENSYENTELGWTMRIPDDWEILDKTNQGIYKEKGKRMVNDFNNENRSYKGLIYLLGFKINQFNIFQSNYEKIDYKDLKAWRENKNQQKRAAAKMYTNQGMKIDTISSTETIDNTTFSVFLITAYNDLGGVRYTQKIYGSYINGYDFAVLLNYNTKEAEETLHKFWKNSTFKK
tara:strand:- start:427377 stop:427979 length:603 start_codon:yes stop_codon:yes gene_type:complete